MTNPLNIVTEIPTENEIRNAIAEFLIYHGWLVLRVNSGAAVTTEKGKRRFVQFIKWMALGQGTQTAGVSDLLCFKPGNRPLAIETKTPGNKPTEAQKSFLAAWGAHGGAWCVASSVDDVALAIGEAQ